MPQKTGLGTTLGFGTTTSYTPKMSSISGPSESVESFDTSHLLSTGYKQYIPDDLIEGGTLTVESFWDPTDGKPPFTVQQTFTLTHNDANGATEVFPGYVDSLDKTMAVGALMVSTFTIKVAGTIVFTP